MPAQWSDPKKWAMGILAAVIVAAAGAFFIEPVRDFFFPPKNGTVVRPPDPEPEFLYKGTVTVRKFDLREKFTEAPELIEFGPFSSAAWPKQQDQIVSDLIEKLRSEKYPDIKFSINGQHLEVSQHLVLWVPPPKDVQGIGARIWYAHADVMPDEPFNLEEFFLSRSEKRQVMRFRCANRVFETDQLTIEESDGVYSFLDDAELISELSVSPRSKVVMLDAFIGKGNPAAEGFAAGLSGALQSAIDNQESLSLSPYNMQQLEQVRSELMQWPHQSPIKGRLVEEYAVDVIISCTIAATEKTSNQPVNPSGGSGES